MAVTVRGTMPVVEETAARVLLRHDAKAALAVALGMAGAMAAVLALVPGPVKYVFAAALALFVLVLGMAGLWRDQLEIDLASRRWRRRSGFLGSVSETRGSLDDIPAVVMALERRPSSGDDPATWNVSIQAPAWKNEVVLAAHAREEAGYAALESWAKKLKRDAVDRTGEQEVRTAWDRLDRTVRDRPAAGLDPEAALEEAFGSDAAARAAERPRPTEQPPPGSRILVLRDAGAKRLVLPPIGWSSGATFVTLFGAAFAAFATFAGLVGLNVIEGVKVNGRILDGPDWGFVAICGFFELIGCGLVLATLVGSRAREFVQDARDQLVFGQTWAGKDWAGRRIEKRAIEGIDLSASPGAAAGRRLRNDPRPPPAAGPTDVRVRTDARVVRLGRELPDADQRWLRDTLEAMARR